MQRLITTSLLAFLSIAGCTASEIVVSGDSNIGNGINGSDGAFTVAGNETFFSNLLGSGTNVVFQTTTNMSSPSIPDSQSAITGYYSSLSGVNVTTLSTFTAANLSGANLFISFLPDTAYSPSELSALSGFLNSGGTVLFTGEAATFDPTADANINVALTALGSSLQIVPANDDSGFNVTNTSQIGSDALDTGVTAFEYGYTSQVSGGTAIFYDRESKAFLEEETLTSAVPEPASLLLAGAGLLLAGVFVRRSRSVSALK